MGVAPAAAATAATVLYFPEGQTVHAVAPTADMDPGGQYVQVPACELPVH